MALNLIKKWFIKRSILSDRDDTGVTKSTALDLDAYIQYRIDNTSGVRPYKVYTALLTQTGTDAPVATVLENTLGGTVVWTYQAVGQYVATLAGAFTLNKTVIIFGNIYNSAPYSFNVVDGDLALDQFVMQSVELSTPALADVLLLNTPIEIRVYP